MDVNNRGKGPTWVYTGKTWSVIGDREVFLLASTNEAAPDGNPDVIPLQGAGELAEEDRRKLDSQGVPPDCCDDVSIVRARYDLDSELQLSRQEVSTTGCELTRDYVLKQLQTFLDNVEKLGAVIHYVGHGKRNTGDWCFKDGFITFKDIMNLYHTTKIHGRALSILSDCSHSGAWLEAACHYLDEQGIRACGHCTVEQKIVMKVHTSCRPGETAKSLCFSVRCLKNDKNTGRMTLWTSKDLKIDQHPLSIDYTTIRCSKPPEEACLLSTPKYTWIKRFLGDRLYLVRGKDRGRPAWHYVLLVDDEEMRRQFEEKVASGTVDVAEYGQVLKSGWGKDPPNDFVDELHKEYSEIYT